MTDERPRGHPAPDRLATALWFLRRPHTYRHLGAMLLRRLLPWRREKEDTRAEATRWAAGRALPWPEALERLGCPPEGDWRDRHAEVLEGARARAAESPVQMGGAGGLDLLYWLVRGTGARRVVETGVAYGWSSLVVLLAGSDLEDARLASTDMPYPRADNEDWVGCVVPDELRARWTLIRRPDRPGVLHAIRALDGPPELVHYDSDKSWEGRRWAYPRLWRALAPGGLFVSDDIQDNVAFRDFAAEVGVEPVIVDGDGKYIGVIRRPS